MIQNDDERTALETWQRVHAAKMPPSVVYWNGEPAVVVDDAGWTRMPVSRFLSSLPDSEREAARRVFGLEAVCCD